MANCPYRKLRPPLPRKVLKPDTLGTTTVQKFIVAVKPGMLGTTTVQEFIVVVMPGTHVATTVQKFIVVVSAVTASNYDSTEIYRRSHSRLR